MVTRSLQGSLESPKQHQDAWPGNPESQGARGTHPQYRHWACKNKDLLGGSEGSTGEHDRSGEQLTEEQIYEDPE